MLAPVIDSNQGIQRAMSIPQAQGLQNRSSLKLMPIKITRTLICMRNDENAMDLLRYLMLRQVDDS
jgi:hypothetical protein